MIQRLIKMYMVYPVKSMRNEGLGEKHKEQNNAVRGHDFSVC